MIGTAGAAGRAAAALPWIIAALAAAALVAAAFAAGELVEERAPKRADQLAVRRAAEWLHAHAPAPGRVAGSRQRLGYYAELPFVPLAGVADEALGRYLSRVEARYVLVEDPEQLAALRRAEGAEMRVLHEVEAAGERAWVVERVPAPGGPEVP